MPFTDNVWQPSYAGAKPLGDFSNPCGAGGAKSLRAELNSKVAILLFPAKIDQGKTFGFEFELARDTTLEVLSNQATIVTSGKEAVLVPLQYKGDLDIATNDPKVPYRLTGRRQYYPFEVRIDQIKANTFFLVVPIRIEGESTERTVRVRFDHRQALGYKSSCELM